MRIEIPGEAAPKGSYRALWNHRSRRAIVTNDNRRTRPWQRTVSLLTQLARGKGPKLTCPVSITAVFYLERPRTAPSSRTRPAVKPDADKLLRALLDGLKQGGAYVDDAQVVEIVARKEYAGGAHDPHGNVGQPRTIVEVRP